MRGSKLMQFLNTLDATEFTAFSKFVRSPFYNNKTELIEFYEFIYNAKKQNKFNAENLKKEFIFQKLYPNEVFNAEKMRRLMSALNLLLKEFMIISNLKSNENLQKKLLLQSYNQRNLSSDYNKEFTSLTKKAKLNQSAKNHLDLFFLYNESHLHSDNLTINPKMLHAELAHQHLNHFYLLSKLHMSCELLNRQLILDKEKNILLFDEAKRVVEQQFQKQNPVYKVYLLILDLLENGYDSNKFKLLENHFFKNLKSLSKQDQFEILILLLNIIIKEINNGNTNAVTIQFRLYKTGLKTKILLFNNRLSINTFTNTVTLGAHLKKISWSKKTIDKYSKYLAPEVKESAVIFCKGIISFNEKDYDNAIQLLNNFSFDKSIFDVIAKFYLIKTYYEAMNKDETIFPRLINCIAAYLKYLDSKNIGNAKIKKHKNFARYTRKIARLKERNVPKKEIYQRYGLDIQNEKYLMGRAWLLAKITE